MALRGAQKRHRASAQFLGVCCFPRFGVSSARLTWQVRHVRWQLVWPEKTPKHLRFNLLRNE